MSRMIICISVMCFFLSGYACAQFSWTGSQGEFSAKIEVDADSISLEETLLLKLELTFPDNYQPDITEIRHQLMRYAGYGPAPFSLVKTTSHLRDTKEHQHRQKFDFTLDPQSVGWHELLIGKITFYPTNGGSPVSLIPPIIDIQVTNPDINIDPKILIAPLMSFSTSLPVTIDTRNRHKYQLNPTLSSRTAQQYTNELHARQLPWLPLMAALAVLFAYLIARSVPLPQKSATKRMSPDELKRAAIRKFNDVAQSDATDHELYEEYYAQLDHAVRKYLEGAYRMATPTMTTQELLQKAAHEPQIDTDTRAKLIHFLHSADRVKYAQYQPTSEEFQSALNELKQLIKPAKEESSVKETD